MKKLLLFLLVNVVICSISNAQQKSSMLGLSASYDYFENRSSYSSDKYIEGITIGLEYTERKGAFGFRAGISYSKIKDYVPYFNQNLLTIDIFIWPQESRISVIDFPLTGQVYLGKKKLKLYLNAGLSTTLSKVDRINDQYLNYFAYDYDVFKSLSFRAIYGGGLTYQFVQHLGMDIGFIKRTRLHTLDDHYLKPADSFGIQTKIFK